MYAIRSYYDQARRRAHRVVGVQRGEHQVPGEARLDRDLRGLEVADLADHDHVGVVPQDRAQRAREGHADARIDLRLRYPGELVLHRVFHRHDVLALSVDARERRV